ncbi:MAG: hypothetical protein Q8Q78_14310 [Hydrogenophaga sp.]|nr:hypothetical protein [Hydrogenophaga sp.]
MAQQQPINYALLGQFLDGCGALDADVDRLLRDGWNTSSSRQVITMGFCRAAFEHAVSQRVLIGAGHHGTALALVRLHFETTVRAAWTLFGASEDWLAKFVEPVPDGSYREPNLGPPIPSMLDAIEVHAPDMALEGRRLYQTVKVMHSFVHGGAHLVAHALRGYPPDKMIDVLRNRNLLCLMLCKVVVVASCQPELSGSVGRLSRVHANVMPPPSTK